MRAEIFKPFTQQAAFLLAHTQYHLGVLEDQMIPVRLVQAIAGQHTCGTLHLKRLFQRVVGFDIAAVQRLTVVTGK